MIDVQKRVRNFDIIELCNFYKRFIKNFNKLILFLISMLKESTEFHKKKLNENVIRAKIETKITTKNDYRMIF